MQRSKRSNEAKGAPSGATGVSSEQSKRQRTHSPAATPAAHDAASQRRPPAAQAAGDTPGPKFTPMRCSPVGSQQRPSAEQKHSQGSPRAASTASQSASAGLNAPAAVRTSAHAAAGPASPSGTQARGHLQRQARTQGTASSLDVSSQQCVPAAFLPRLMPVVQAYVSWTAFVELTAPLPVQNREARRLTNER